MKQEQERPQKISLVLLAIVSKDQILELDFNLDPFFIRQGRPDVVRFGDGRLVGLENHLGPIIVDMHCTQDQNQTTERCVRRDCLQPIIVQVEQNHLRLCCFQYQVTKLLHLTSLNQANHLHCNGECTVVDPCNIYCNIYTIKSFLSLGKSLLLAQNFYRLDALLEAQPTSL